MHGLLDPLLDAVAKFVVQHFVSLHRLDYLVVLCLLNGSDARHDVVLLAAFVRARTRLLGLLLSVGHLHELFKRHQLEVGWVHGSAIDG